MRGAPHDQAEIVQAHRSRADAEDRRELHVGARGATGRAGAHAQRTARARHIGRGDPRRTGRGWEEWFDLLDDWGALERSHREIARWVAEQLGIEPLAWNAQAVAHSYERARGLRAAGERPDGFAITAQKTVAVPVDRFYDAFLDDAVRAHWLPEADLRLRTASRPRSARFDWGDGDTRVHVTFIAKGEAKSTAALQHERLADAQEAERMKAFWRDGVAALKDTLER
jgi:hypothetical protein